jgi:diguanylate cyclase (GGDEF)-like protein
VLLGSLRQQLFQARTGARVDALTGIANRAAFLTRLEHDLALARRHAAPLTLGYLDLDDFKLVNDGQGHGEGDRVLRAFADVLRGALRDADTVARLGGDEFAILLPGTGADAARGVVDRLRAALASDGPPLRCSLGVVTFLSAPRDVETALRAADDVLYGVKRAGKNAVRFETVDLPEVELRPLPPPRKTEPTRAGTKRA